jgi:hypothetical protein
MPIRPWPDRVDPLRWPRDTLYPQKLALTSLTRGGRSVGIVCLRIKATEFSSLVIVKATLWKLLSMTWVHLQSGNLAENTASESQMTKRGKKGTRRNSQQYLPTLYHVILIIVLIL